MQQCGRDMEWDLEIDREQQRCLVFFFFGKDTNSFVTKETIGKGESLQVMAERRKGLGWAGMRSVPLTGNGTIGKNPDLFLFFLQIDFWFILHWGKNKQTNKPTSTFSNCSEEKIMEIDI